MGKIKNIFNHVKFVLPLLLGVLLGSGLTKNKAVLSILIPLILLIFIKKIVVYAKKNKSKDQSVKNAVGVSMINWYIRQVEAGMQISDKIFYACYTTWIFIVDILLFVFGIWFLVKGNYLWGFILLMSLQIIITQNQIWRNIK